MVSRWLMLLAVVLLSGACHVYREVPGAPLPADGARLALHLTDSGSVVLARLVGPAAEVIEGDLVRVDERDITLAVRRVRVRGGLSNEWAGEQVAVPRVLVDSVRERRLSRLRSLVFAGGVLAAAALGANGAVAVGGGGRGGRGGGTGER